MKKLIGSVFLALVFLTIVLNGCAPASTPVPPAPPTNTPVPTSTPTKLPTVTPIPPTPTVELSSGHAVGPSVPDSALLFVQNFETDSTEDAVAAIIPQWEVVVDETGNHILCNQESDDFLNVGFGSDSWTDYAVEMRVESVGQKQEPYASLYARVDPQNSAGYNAALNFETKFADLQFSDPYLGLGHQQLQWISGNTWYLLRLEVDGYQIKYYIDNMLIEQVNSNQRDNGGASFSTSRHLMVCVDDIRAWALPANNEDEDVQPKSKQDSILYMRVAVYPQVWANKSPTGIPSYEFKTNCSQDFNILETCFLWDLTRVTVTTPSGMIFHLKKDFNINKYSGEITRRWVLYGPDGGGLPENGDYTFTYYKGGKVVFVQPVNYTQSVVTPVTNITAVQNGNSLEVNWQRPIDMTSDKWGKVYISLNRRIKYSHRYDWDEEKAVLTDLTLVPGVRYEIDVDVASQFGGTSGGETFYLVWKAP